MAGYAAIFSRGRITGCCLGAICAVGGALDGGTGVIGGPERRLRRRGGSLVRTDGEMCAIDMLLLRVAEVMRCSKGGLRGEL
jgi:hypothetical protein